MSWIRGALYRALSFIRPGTSQRDTDDEIRFHLDMQAREHLNRGSSPHEAQMAARQAFGNVGDLKDTLRDVRGAPPLAGVGDDVRYSFRRLRRDPGFAAVVICTLALGIGWTTAIFSVVDAALLRPLPYAHPEQLVELWQRRVGTTMNRGESSVLELEDYRTQQSMFAAVSGYRQASVTMTGNAGAEPLVVGRVNAGFFSLLGAQVSAGRDFNPDEDSPTGGKAIILSDALWRSRFGGSPSVIGRTTIIDAEPYTVVGVMPAAFSFAPLERAQAWVPLLAWGDSPARGNRWARVVARLRPGLTVGDASRQFDVFVMRLARDYPQTTLDRGGNLVPLRDEIVGTNRPLLVLLLSAAGALLLIGCANVTGLVLPRILRRRRELAVRVALGAGGWRVIRQLVVENLLLGIIGGALGIGVAYLSLQGLIAQIPPAMISAFPFVQHAHLDWRVLSFASLVSILTGVLSGVIPAVLGARRPMFQALRQSGRGGTQANRWVRRLLVSGELALTLALLCGSLLFAQNLMRLLHADPGFRSDGLLVGTINLVGPGYRDSTRRHQAFAALEERIRAMPGVQGVALGSDLPLEFGSTASFVIEGAAQSGGTNPEARVRFVNASYFDVLGVPLLSGTAFAASDSSSAARSVIVSQAFVKAFLDGANPLGRRIRFSDTERYEIIGVVGDVALALGRPVVPTFYLAASAIAPSSMRMAVRVAGDPERIVPALRRTIDAVDPQNPLTGVEPMARAISGSREVFFRKFPMLLIAVFTTVGLTLAIMGVYGVVAYAVAQRTREIGIRSALGASRRNLLLLAASDGLLSTVLGVVGGLAITFAVAKLLSAFIFDIRGGDVVMYAAGACAVLTVATVASVLPALKAMNISPAIALSDET
jgi:putative ABC transport system permease protein